MREINGFLEAVIYNRLAWDTKVSLWEVRRKRSITFFLNPSVCFACHNDVFAKFNGMVAWNARWNVCQTFWIYHTSVWWRRLFRKTQNKKLRRFLEDSCQPHPSWPIKLFSQSPTPPQPSHLTWNGTPRPPGGVRAPNSRTREKASLLFPDYWLICNPRPILIKLLHSRQSLRHDGHFLHFDFLQRFRRFLADGLQYPTIMIYRTWRRFIF